MRSYLKRLLKVLMELVAFAAGVAIVLTIIQSLGPEVGVPIFIAVLAVIVVLIPFFRD